MHAVRPVRTLLLTSFLAGSLFLSACGNQQGAAPSWAQVTPPTGPAAPAAAGRALLYDSLADAATAGDLYTTLEMTASAAPLEQQGADGLTPFLTSVKAGHPRLARVLASAGANTHAVDTLGQSAMHLAAAADNVYMIDTLYRHGLSVDARTLENFSPLHTAAAAGSTRAIKELLKLGASPKLNARRDQYSTPLIIAGESKRWEATALLWALGSSYNIHHAAGAGDLRMVQRLIETDKSYLESPTAIGGTPLLSSIASKQVEVARYLLEAGANPDAVVIEGDTALTMAVDSGLPEMVDLLLQHGQNVNQPNPSWNNETALHRAVRKGNLELAAFLLSRNADFNRTTRAGLTPLHAAVAAGSVDMVKLFLEHGASMEVRTPEGLAPLHVAAAAGRVDVAQLLLTYGANPDITDAGLNTPLHLAARDGQVAALHLLAKAGARVDAQNSAGQTPLHLAAAAGQKEVATALLEIGAPPDARDRLQQTPLFAATAAGHEHVAQLLLDHGANVGAFDAQSRSALFPAAENGRREVTLWLLDKGLDPHIRDAQGQTLLFAAAGNHNSSFTAWLLELGVNPKLADHAGATAVHAAARAGKADTLALLVEHRAAPDVPDAEGRTPLHWAAEAGRYAASRWLVAKGANPRQTDNKGRKPLHYAALTGQVELIRLLLERGGDPNAADNEGASSLHLATEAGAMATVELLLSAGAHPILSDKKGRIPLLIARNRIRQVRPADDDTHALEYPLILTRLRDAVYTKLWSALQAKDAEQLRALLAVAREYAEASLFGKTPLHWAAEAGCPACVRELLAAGADPNLVSATFEQSTPLFVAASKGHKDIVEALLAAGALPAPADIAGLTPAQAAFQGGYTDIVLLLAAAITPAP
ncbi:MAG: ankyrin repeat domain-containing protein [Candidatus Hydrogenedentes bacterium]|nr:ankyrin repeat domain-containing protein [Candidatus Hydrogenedentota bacterium]